MTTGWIVRRDLRNIFLPARLGVLIGIDGERGHLAGAEIHLLGRSDRIAIVIRETQHRHAWAVRGRQRIDLNALT